MLYLLRHGQTDWNIEKKIQGQADIPLNKLGEYQALSAADTMKIYHLDTIISSDLWRARRTAQIVGETLGIKHTCDARWREYDFGELTGQSSKGLTVDVSKRLANDAAKYGAEPFNAAFNRVAGAMRDIDFDRDTLVVTHGGLLRIVMCFLEDQNKFNIDSYLYKCANEHIGNAAIFRLRTINSKLERIR